MPRLPYTKLSPELYEKLTALGHAIHTGTALPPALLALLCLRASILNGCSFCTGMHTAELRRHHEPASRIEAVADWPSSDAFTPRERAALAWTDAVTRLPAAGIDEPAFAAAHEFFADKDLVDLTYAIANINAWNRLGIAFAMEWAPPQRTSAQAAL